MGESFLSLLLLLVLVGLSWCYFFVSCSLRKKGTQEQIIYNIALLAAYVVIAILLVVGYITLIQARMLPGGMEGLGSGIALALLAFGVACVTIVLRVLSEVAYQLRRSNKAL